MKRIITGILLLAVLTILAGCVSRETYENVQQDLLIAEEAVSDQQAQIAELASSLEQTGADLEETQVVLQDTELQLAETQEQLRAISETPFGLYYIVDTTAGQQVRIIDSRYSGLVPFSFLPDFRQLRDI